MSGSNPKEVFTSIITDARLGINSYRTEILLSAFARCIFTCTSDGFAWIKEGDAVVPTEFKAALPGRTIGFLV